MYILGPQYAYMTLSMIIRYATRPISIKKTIKRATFPKHCMTNVARYWLGTCYCENRPQQLPVDCAWIKGQQEKCPTTDRLHWQIFACFSKPQRLSALRTKFCGCHWEASRSTAAEAYVWKEETRVEDTQFELGQRPFKRNSEKDWSAILNDAKCGNLENVPADVFIRYYRQLTSIASDYQRPIGVEKVVHVFWGRTGTGKSRRAWEEAGLDAYSKDPRTKWFDGYRGEENIIIDEFRGAIDIAHVLRWLDRYPVRVERKGSSVPFRGIRIWITSNLSPEQWYPDLDEETKLALLRRLTNIIHFE